MVKSFAHWGSSEITGRGLFAIAGNGSIAQIVLEPGENYIAHPRSAKDGRKVILVLTLLH